MFKTFIISLGVLILGMLFYLYCEISDMRAAVESTPAPRFILDIAPLGEDMSDKEIDITISSSGDSAESIHIHTPGRYTIQDWHITEVR